MAGGVVTNEVTVGTVAGGAVVMTVAALAAIPEEDIWLAKQKSARTRRAYKQDVAHFMRTIHIQSQAELRQVDHRAVIAWERHMRDVEKAAPSTIRRRLAAFSSLFKHLVRHSHVDKNPASEVERPAINRDEGTTLAFSKSVPGRSSTGHAMTPSRDSATGRFYRSDCRSDSAAPKSPRLKWEIYTRTAATTRCV